MADVLKILAAGATSFDSAMFHGVAEHANPACGERIPVAGRRSRSLVIQTGT